MQAASNTHTTILSKPTISLLILFLVVKILIGCSVQHRNDLETIYIEEYKLRYFEGCLKYGFNNSREIKKLLKWDSSGMSEPILGTEYLFIDSLARKEGEKLRLDSVNLIGNLAEGKEGKEVILPCLCLYNSRWLDSIAHEHLRKINKK